MIDYYRKSILSQRGKDAGNKKMPDYLRLVVNDYKEILQKCRKQKEKPKEDFGLYL